MSIYDVEIQSMVYFFLACNMFANRSAVDFFHLFSPFQPRFFRDIGGRSLSVSDLMVERGEELKLGPPWHEFDHFPKHNLTKTLRLQQRLCSLTVTISDPWMAQNLDCFGSKRSIQEDRWSTSERRWSTELSNLSRQVSEEILILPGLDGEFFFDLTKL